MYGRSVICRRAIRCNSSGCIDVQYGWENLVEYLINGQLPPLAYCPFTDIAWFNMHFWGGLATATAYFIFPVALYRIWNHSRTFGVWISPSPWVIAGLGAFVFSCGVGHILENWSMFSGHVRLQAAWMMITGFVSISTDLGLWLHGTDLKRWAGHGRNGYPMAN